MGLNKTVLARIIGSMGGPTIWRQFATACYVPRETLAVAGVTTATQMMSRSPHFARAAVTKLKVAIPNWRWNTSTHIEEGVGGTPTCEASIEYPAGTFTRVQFSGADVGNLPNGSCLLSDEVALTIPKDAWFGVRIFRSGFTPGEVPITLQRNSALGEAAAYGTSVTNMVMGGTISNTGSPQFRPCAIITNQNLKAPLLIGDSRCFGVGDTGDSSGDMGELARSFGPDVGYINAGVGSDRAQWWLNSYANRAAMAQWCSHVVSQIAVNDLGGGQTAANILNYVKSIRAVFSGMPFYTATVPVAQPNAGAQATYNAARVSYNNLLRAGVAEFTGYFENADALEGSSYNSGVTVRDGGWIAVAANYSDLLHESQTGYLAIKNSASVRASMLA